MSRRADAVILEMIAMIDFAKGEIDNIDFLEFEHDKRRNLAAQRALEIISEASRHIPEHILEMETQIYWPDIRAIGNRMCHEYHRVSNELVFEIIRDDLNPLRAALERMLARLSSTHHQRP